MIKTAETVEQVTTLLPPLQEALPPQRSAWRWYVLVVLTAHGCFRWRSDLCSALFCLQMVYVLAISVLGQAVQNGAMLALNGDAAQIEFGGALTLVHNASEGELVCSGKITASDILVDHHSLLGVATELVALRQVACSGHGTWSSSMLNCTCNSGWGGSACATTFSPYDNAITSGDMTGPTRDAVLPGIFFALDSTARLSADMSGLVRNGALELVASPRLFGWAALKHLATGPDSYTISYYKDDLTTPGVVNQPAADPVVPVTPGETWRFSAWCLADANTSGISVDAQLYMFACDQYGRSLYLQGWLDAGKPQPDVHPHSTNDTWSVRGQCVKHRWSQLELTATIPHSPSSHAPYQTLDHIDGVQLRLDNDGGAGAVVYWDGLEMRRTTHP